MDKLLHGMYHCQIEEVAGIKRKVKAIEVPVVFGGLMVVTSKL